MYRNIHICGKFLTKIIHPLKWVSELHVLENFLNVFETLFKLIYRLLNINDQYTDFLSQLFKEKDRLVIKILFISFFRHTAIKVICTTGFDCSNQLVGKCWVFLRNSDREYDIKCDSVLSWPIKIFYKLWIWIRLFRLKRSL